ncbi:class I SAM-dependent methyltransferase [Natronolimnohabitans sp. A-GB9]|uniref:class I SAM-dependent methyltransferase n=1 Tax=Natronolimnohabitans sp. A-GB9 TaxID=3069757 RepID=UPI0027B4FEE2|nr:class I SAM-dependent methyltransferase [Natronolimnohabitans sp. A-GB9]MDQ2049117.1 class I SAM-dependent methyltransferase [Natronolimnohabitans sp. A-GB9]
MNESKLAYLAAKRTVDDRALNRHTFDRFANELATREEPVRIVELGAGVGTMIGRLVTRDALPDRVSYRAVDRDPACIDYARERVPEWVAAAGYEIEAKHRDRPGTTTFVARDDDRRLEITLETADGFAIDDRADAVLGAAFFDLVDLETAIPAVEDLLAPDGVLYAPITFDGGTSFAPRDPLDERLERWYHRHMDEIRDGGSSRAGQALLTTLPARGWDVLAAGGSDWVVRPAGGADEGDGDGMGYPARERVVVSHLLETIENATAAFVPDRLDADERTRWLERRRCELAADELVAVAHNLDVLARFAGDTRRLRTMGRT